MPSVLNVSNDASRKPEYFSLKDIEVFVDSEEQNWFKWAHLGKYLGHRHIGKSAESLNKCERLTRHELIPIPCSMAG